MSAPLPLVLDRLDHVREIRPGQYRAKCPAHDGKSTDSLSVSEGKDGAVLLHCWGACPNEDVVAALGLTMRDLFPPRDLSPDARRAYSREQSLTATRRILAHELTCLLQIVTAQIHRWPIEDPDPEGRERQAVARIRSALGGIYG
ncbi:MAG: hypothetical protein EOM91_22345 [Sphingobacteriia bacterium]|nr:hypothetical protein [Sphingobacteriia bacterium]